MGEMSSHLVYLCVCWGGSQDALRDIRSNTLSKSWNSNFTGPMSPPLLGSLCRCSISVPVLFSTWPPTLSSLRAHWVSQGGHCPDSCSFCGCCTLETLTGSLPFPAPFALCTYRGRKCRKDLRGHLSLLPSELILEASGTLGSLRLRGVSPQDGTFRHPSFQEGWPGGSGWPSPSPGPSKGPLKMGELGPGPGTPLQPTGVRIEGSSAEPGLVPMGLLSFPGQRGG